MITIYHNPRCKKSRAGLQYLEEKGVDFNIRKYLQEPLSKAELKDLLMKLDKKPTDIIRTQEEIYKKQFKGKNYTDDEWLEVIVENPKLLQRPIVEKEYKAVLAQPPENIDKLL